MTRQKKKITLAKILVILLYIFAASILAWILVSFIATIPYVESKPDQPWSFFEWLIRLSDKIAEMKGGV